MEQTDVSLSLSLISEYNVSRYAALQRNQRQQKLLLGYTIDTTLIKGKHKLFNILQRSS